MSTYKIVKRGQFAYGTVTSRNGDKISIALLDTYETAIVSQAYKVFEIIDENLLLPEYLMMWFRRPEFDRYARFMSHGSTREVFDWEEMCDVELPIPDITEQRAIVDEYHVIQERIRLNETMISRLEDTAQALYRQWFVDYEFPDDSGKPYKSSGGEMEYSEELGKEVPKGWKVEKLSNYCDFQNGYSYTSEELKQSKLGMVTIKNFDKNGGYKIDGLKEIMPLKNYKEKTIEIGDVLVAHTDLTQGKIIGNPLIILGKSNYDTLIFSMDTVKIISKISGISNTLFYFILMQNNFHDFALGYVNGSTVMHLSKNALSEYSILFPDEIDIVKRLSKVLSIFITQESTIFSEIESLGKMKELILVKMARVG